MKQHIPALFKEIIRAHDLHDALKREAIIPFQTYKDLHKSIRELRKAAELALQWNFNKGNTS